ncbi:ABC transporter substrate-binding protein [Anaerocolumna jejuensis]|uniref:ABC transporter substrate-binding protein n=1 Tax=Anaerocolumna jejuensis TaxID=259063 RepID=UPI003F7BEA1D
MKRKGIAVLAVILLVAVFLPGCSKSDGSLTKVQLNEVAHSIFYAPQYAAIELGYFKDEGIDLALVNGLGADKTMTAVLSGDADIGFMGPEATVYVYNEGKEDYVVNFAQLTQRAGNFLVTKDKNETFTWDNLRGKTVVGGRAGGMPEMVFEYILKKNGLDPKSDLSIVQNIDFGLTAQAFAAGTGDYTIEFEPAATALEKEGTGKVAASLGVESGKVPYTAYSAKKSYIEKHPEVIQKFTNAVQKGLDYVNSHKPEEIAKTIQPQFKETDLDTLTAIVKRYYDQQTWKENTVFQEDSFNLLQDILEDGGVISTRAPYDKVVTTVYSEKVK